MFCEKCGNVMKEGTTFCTNCGNSINGIKNNKFKKYKNPIIIICILIVIICIILGIKDMINKQNNTNFTNFDIVEEKVFITQDSDVSPTGKEYTGDFSKSLTEIYNVYEKGNVTIQKKYYKTGIENMKHFSVEVLINDKKMLENIYYYNSKNNKLIGSKEVMNDINSYQSGLEYNGITLDGTIMDFINGSMNCFLNAHNDNTSEEALNKLKKHSTYVENNFSKEKEKIFDNGNYSFTYKIMGDTLVVFTKYKNNTNKMEVLLFAYDESKNPEQEIKNWYDKVITLNETEENEIATTNFIDDIYTKYPELKDKEIICYNDYGEYWLLDKEGKKIYFSDLESFEIALGKCNNEDQIVVVWKDMNDEQMKKFAKELLISKCEKENIGSEYIEGIKENTIKEKILTENNSLTYIVMSLTPKRWSGQTVYHYIDTYILQIIANTNSSKWKEYDYSEYIENNIYYIKYNKLDSIGSSNYSDSSTSNISNISKEDLNKGIQKATEKVNEYLNKNQD